MPQDFSSPTRRRLLAGSVGIASVSAAALDFVPQPSGAGGVTWADPTSVRPFRFTASDAALTDLRNRLAATRLPEKETVSDFTQGVPLKTIQQLLQYWGHGYDWRKAEARLNAHPQFVTEIEGLDIHFLHVRSKHENALPLIVTHGWPGSVMEQLKIIAPLTDPTAHGGSAADAFHVIIPSLPGFGFSGKPTATGWDPPRIARAWSLLMQRLGYDRYVAQGGDWGALVTEQMGVLAPPGLLGIHINLPSAVPADMLQAVQTGAPPPSDLSADERWAFDRLTFFFAKGLSYAQEMGNRPQTLYGLADSPVGLAGWFLDHDRLSLELIARAFDGRPGGLTRDDVLDDITLSWLTNSGVSSGRLYWENKLAFFAPMGVKIPVAVSAFPDDIYQAPRSWVERAYPRLAHYGRPEKGGHFAAWEQPTLLVHDVREGFRQLRKA